MGDTKGYIDWLLPKGLKEALQEQLVHSCNGCIYNSPKYSIPNICPTLGKTVRGNCAFWRDENEKLENEADEP